VAVTGATGFIGRHVITRLAAGGIAVRAIVRRRLSAPASIFPPDVVIVPAPLETDALVDAFRGIDTVVHLAGVVSTVREDQYTKVNVGGTRAVAAAARAVQARLVHVSSLAAAGPAPPTRPRSEGDPPAPITPYGRSKLESEHVVAGIAGLKWIVLRPGVVYGPGDRALLPLFRFAKAGVLPLVGRRDAAYTFIHVDDVTRTIEAAIAADIDQETIFVGSAVSVTALELLERVRAAAGTRAIILPVPRSLTRLVALAGDLAGVLRGRPAVLNSRRYRELYAEGFTCRVDRLRERLGVVAKIGLTEGLAQTAAWYKQHGKL
jgi:dihydroflavonol-4-reductase